VLRNALVGRLGLLAAVLVFASACGDGQISDGPGARIGPDASDDGAFDPAANDPPVDDPPVDDPPAMGPPSTSSDWWGVVTKPDATNTGPNCTGRAGCPSATLSAGNAPPSTITQDGATYENFTMTGTLDIDANNVTLRNFSFNASGVGSSDVIHNTGTNLVIEYAYINGGGSDCGQIFNSNGWTVRYSEFENCDDIVKISDDNGVLGPVLVEDSYWHNVPGGHGDTIQIWPGTSSDITFRRNHLEGGNTSIVIDWDVNAPARLLFEENWLHGGGASYVIYCSGSGGGDRIYRNNLFDRNFLYGARTDPGCTWNNNSYMDNLAPVQ